VKSYAERRVFPQHILDLRDRIQERMKLIPDTYGNELRCHELARAVWQVFDPVDFAFFVQDGKVGMVDHSWLEVHFAGRGCILDVYAPGVVPQVLLVDGWAVHPFFRTYKPGDRRTDIDDAMVDRLVAHLKLRSED
jgi:hypothetical protein